MTSRTGAWPAYCPKPLIELPNGVCFQPVAFRFRRSSRVRAALAVHHAAHLPQARLAARLRTHVASPDRDDLRSRAADLHSRRLQLLDPGIHPHRQDRDACELPDVHRQVDVRQLVAAVDQDVGHGHPDQRPAGLSRRLFSGLQGQEEHHDLVDPDQLAVLDQLSVAGARLENHARQQRRDQRNAVGSRFHRGAARVSPVQPVRGGPDAGACVGGIRHSADLPVALQNRPFSPGGGGRPRRGPGQTLPENHVAAIDAGRHRRGGHTVHTHRRRLHHAHDGRRTEGHDVRPDHRGAVRRGQQLAAGQCADDHRDVHDNDHHPDIRLAVAARHGQAARDGGDVRSGRAGRRGTHQVRMVVRLPRDLPVVPIHPVIDAAGFLVQRQRTDGAAAEGFHARLVSRDSRAAGTARCARQQLQTRHSGRDRIDDAGHPRCQGVDPLSNARTGPGIGLRAAAHGHARYHPRGRVARTHSGHRCAAIALDDRRGTRCGQRAVLDPGDPRTARRLREGHRGIRPGSRRERLDDILARHLPADPAGNRRVPDPVVHRLVR